MVNIGDVVRVKSDAVSSLSERVDAETTFEVIALHFGPGNDPEGNVDLRRPDGKIEPWFPASRLERASARQSNRRQR
ncbi:hypothetical protein GCM10007874_35930 [Labrys miyagiensis]|uniref:Uncharacterized protein n=1 Tax=Labrys miyagiensis TaxID=346912 RepID=A0ABQ6CJM8_9HYPH|nr:hypothetical protein [Labrys miyagiensis]GLS20576.1 hypothetical protein GCM10007874_35930 [Labrys miyagiensis]